MSGLAIPCIIIPLWHRRCVLNEYTTIEVHGRARREAARRRKSEYKVNLLSRNSSRSNDSWRMSPKSTKYSALQRRLAGAATNEAAPLTRAAHSNTLLIKTTHDSTPVAYASTTWFERLRKETRGVWICVGLQCTTHLGWVNMWTKVHHVAWKSLVRIFSLAPKLSGLRRCILSQFNCKFSRLKFFWGTTVPVVVCASKAWSIWNACKNLRGQHPQGLKCSLP